MNQVNRAYTPVPQAQYNVAPGMMDAFEFTADDLAANRMGTVSDNQRSNLKVAQGQWGKQMVKVLGVMLVFAAGYIIVFPTGNHIREFISQQIALAVPLIGIVILLWLAMVGFYWRRSRRLPKSKVSNTSGVFKMIGKPVNSTFGPVYQHIKIGRRDFYVTEVQAQVLTPGASYIAYFVGGGLGAKIISVEPSGHS